jgi:hypothetical protein
VAFDTTCERRDNGVKAASCSNDVEPENLNPLPVTHRRYLVADLESGIAVGFGFYDVAIPGFALFKVVAGKLRFIDTGVALIGEGATTSGWD